MKNRLILFSAFLATALDADHAPWSNPLKILYGQLVNSNMCNSAGSDSRYSQDITSYTRSKELEGYQLGPSSNLMNNPSGSGSTINYVFFKVHDYPYDFDGAQQKCIDFDPDSRLASVFSQSENDMLLSLKTKDKTMWIGLNDKNSENSFKWVNSDLEYSEMDYSYWAPGEPNNSGANEDCVELWSSYSRRYDDEGGVRREWSQGAWNDDRCLKTIDTFACEVRVFAECNCKPGYSGNTCQNHICNVNNPCSGTADCVVDSNELGYKCNCKPGFSGENCEVSPCVKNRFSESSN